MEKWWIEWQTNGKAAENQLHEGYVYNPLNDMRKKKFTMIDGCQIAFMHYIHVPISPNHTYHSERG